MAAQLPKCAAITVQWDKYNYNTDMYDVKVTITTGMRDQNGDGIAEIATNHVLHDVRLEEDGWYGSIPYTTTFAIPKYYISGALTISVTARRRYRGAQDTRTITCTIKEDVIPVPASQAILMCAPDDRKIIVPPSDPNLYTIYWYDALRDGNLVHKGESYNRNFPEGLTMLYVSQVDKLDCATPSVRVSIAVYVLPVSVFNSLPKIKNSVELQPDPDPRMNIPRCTRGGTYYDLPDLPNLPLEPPLPAFLSIEFSSPRTLWRDDINYGSPGYPKRVCNSHLPDKPGGEQLYIADLEFTVDLKLIAPEGLSTKNVAQSTLDCRVENVMQTLVYRTRTCNSNIVDATDPNYGVYPDHLQSCSKSTLEPVNICPNTLVEIGPGEEDYPPFPTPPDPRLKSYYEYNWTTPQGLSSTTIRNPIVSSENMPVSKGSYYRYTCVVKTVTPFLRIDPNNPLPSFNNALDTTSTSETYCVYVYRCPDCGQQRPSQKEKTGGVLETQTTNEGLETADFGVFNKDIQLYPNPANTILTLEYRSTSSAETRVELINLLGQRLQTWLLTNESSRNELDISSIPTGLYICTLYNGTNRVDSKRIQIIH